MYRDYRPKIHFTPPAMWMNDPNGLVWENGRYHFFYQYHPYDTLWGPMHWGHAVSPDLLHWEHLPAALSPDQLGAAFSGSAVYDKQNCSGFGAFGKAPLVLLYTSHGEYEQQSLAWSLDGVHFTPYDQNPVIPNQALKDFRDPKIFWNSKKGRWGLTLAAGDRAMFYGSDDLVHWEKTGEFGPGGNMAAGVWECPDLFPLTAPDGEEVWVLVVSMICQEGQSNPGDTQYFLGNFDGEAFVCTKPFTEPVFLDAGRDCYAGVTYQNTNERIFMGWASNWAYARELPTGCFRGQATLPRRLSLKETPCGLRLAAEPMAAGSLLGAPVPLEGEVRLPGETFAVRLKGEGACSLMLKNKLGEVLRYSVNGQNELVIDRREAGQGGFSPLFTAPAYACAARRRLFDGPYQLELIFDVSVAELFMDGGTVAATTLVYPTVPYDTVAVEGASGELYPINL